MCFNKKAFAIKKEVGDRKGEKRCYGNLGVLFRSLGEYVKANEYLEKATATIMEIGDRAGEPTCCGNLGTCCRKLGTVFQVHVLSEYVKAKEYEKPLAICIETGSRESNANSQTNMPRLKNITSLRSESE